ncbi:MAG: YceI family protein, partial [Flavisolibacter sp.]
MKHLLLYGLLIFSTPLFSQYRPVDKGSKIEFKVKNLGFTVSGSFSGIGGNIFFDPQNLSSSSINVSVDASTVNTDNSMRDDHLRGDSYFDVTKYP